MYAHGVTFGGHPVMCAIALKNIEIMKRERIMEHVLGTEDAFRSTLEQLLDLPIVGDVRGTAATSMRSSSSRTRRRARPSATRSARRCCAGSSRRGLFERGLICRADDRGDPVIQLSPPLVAAQAEFDEMTGILGDVLTEAWGQVETLGVAPQSASAVAADYDIRLIGLTKRFDDVVAVSSSRFFLTAALPRAPRAVGLRQDHDATDDRRF